MPVKVSLTVRNFAHQMGYKPTVAFMLRLHVCYGCLDGRDSLLVELLYIIWICVILSSDIDPTHINALTTVCAATITAAMPNITTWTAAITMTILSIRGRGEVKGVSATCVSRVRWGTCDSMKWWVERGYSRS